MTTPPATLGMLIAQRLCHDLVNPLGAIGNGLELLAMTQPDTPETLLMRDSLDHALGRIKLYRIAFGPAGETSETAATELAAALNSLGGSRPLQLLTNLPPRLPRSTARLTALMALCAETALAWGGTLTIGLDDDRLSVVAEAPRLREDDAHWTALAEGRDPDDPTPPLVHFALVGAAAGADGRRLRVERSPNRLALTA